MKRVIPVVLGTVLLGGCALPVPLQVASWALDGLTFLVTKKSITDHGISAVAQQDCALWRGISEGAVCREDDPMTSLADAGDVTATGQPVARGDGEQEGLVTSALGMQASSATAQGSDSDDRRMLRPVGNGDDSVEQIVTSWQRPLEAEQPASMEMAGFVFEPAYAEPIASIASIASIAPVAKPVAAKTPSSVVSAVITAQAGNYYVIGSFAKWNNAARFAQLHEDLEAKVVSADLEAGRVYRIMIGPFDATSRQGVQASLQRVGLEGAWAMRMKHDAVALDWAASPDTQVAALPNP